ncbi:hypothetical protein SCHPADRAFT_613288 [Schizopora paradoxa]|uniref:UBC core domain-containing protein n=1 Tax=Schizopora paradoxa TaxID=27342 RepID=A0A0H2R8Z1_9AGAM|nr:hypothetical protein SCHPADRAFT_613288 [Schizopora paradoxa]
MNHLEPLADLQPTREPSQLEKKNGRPLYSLYRLQYDLAQLAEDLPRGVRVVTDDADMSRFCLILEPQEGYLVGSHIHISVSVPENWPCVPLSCRIDTTFEHPNIFGGYICCDILKVSNYESVASYNGGYSPAYSLAGTFMQLASFFSTSVVEQSYGYVHNVDTNGAEYARESLFHSSRYFDCTRCNWKSIVAAAEIPVSIGSDLPSLGKSSKPIKPLRKNVKKANLTSLNDDILLEVIEYLDTKSLLIFAKLYERVASLVRDTNVIAKREMRCFVTKRDPRETILGVGLQYHQNYKTFTSTFDYASKFAFDELGIRKDSNNRPIEFWLPLAIDGNHYAKASSDVRERLMLLDSEARIRSMTSLDSLKSKPQPQSGLQQDPIKHLIGMANALVVEFMKTCDKADYYSRPPMGSYMFLFKPESSLLKASERALAGYCSLIHLIASYAVENPNVISDAHRTVSAFITSQAGRHKSVVPDLGQFMILLCLVDEFSWSNVRTAVIQELFTRFVVWQLHPTPKGAGRPGLALLEEDAVCEWRLAESFKASRVGLRLCLFQIFFMEKLAKREGSSLVGLRDDFNSRRGLAPPGLTTELLERIQSIYKVDNLGTFAKESGRPASREGMTKFLRERVVESAQAGYHRSTSSWPLERLQAYRARDDLEFRQKLLRSGNHTVAASNDQPPFFPQGKR